MRSPRGPGRGPRSRGAAGVGDVAGEPERDRSDDGSDSSPAGRGRTNRRADHGHDQGDRRGHRATPSTSARWTFEPGFAGPPPHVHERLHDMFYVLEGTLTMRLGDDTDRAGGRQLRLRTARRCPYLQQPGQDPVALPQLQHSRGLGELHARSRRGARPGDANSGGNRPNRIPVRLPGRVGPRSRRAAGGAGNVAGEAGALTTQQAQRLYPLGREIIPVGEVSSRVSPSAASGPGGRRPSAASTISCWTCSGTPCRSRTSSIWRATRLGVLHHPPPL